MKCKYCSSENLIRRGARSGRQRYECKECRRFTSGQVVIQHTNRSARILLLDIETSPMEYYSWSRDPQYLSPEMKIKDWGILCWSAKWLFEPEIMGQSVTPKEAINRTQDSILGGILNLYPGYRLLSCTPLFLKYDWLKTASSATKFIGYFLCIFV